MTRPLYAIGDIHGQKTMLEDALARIDRDGGGAASVVFVGDYVDRGPDSAGVIETLVQGRAGGRDWVCLKGNHDRLFEWFIDPVGPKADPHLLVGYHWFHDRIGGAETIGSYGVDLPERIRTYELARQVRAAVPDSHADFLRGLKLTHREGGLMFVHAGIRPGVPLDAQDEEDLVWIRDPFLDDPRDHGALIVHGHTALDHPQHHGNRVNLDGGAGYGRPLVPAVFEDGQAWLLTETGRQPLSPL